eukprot:496893-Alexandrium_andersonii.AAC.1
MERDVEGVRDVSSWGSPAARATHVSIPVHGTTGEMAGWGRSGMPGPLGSIPELLDAPPEG